MVLGGGLRDLRTDVQDVAVDGLSYQLRVKVLHNPVEPNVVAVVLRYHIVSHLLHLEQISVVQFHKVATDERQPYKSNVKEILCFALTVLEVLFECVLEISWAIRNNRTYLANSVFSPYLEAFIEFLAVNGDIVIYREEDVGFALFGDFVAPIHGVVRSPIEIDRPLP